MEKKFYIYDDQGNPSSQGFTADEIKGKGLNPDTIVCPEFGQPGKMSDFQELAGWAPPKLDKKNRKAILTGKARTYVMAAALAVTGGGGAYYVHEKQSEKAIEVSECLENRRKDEISLRDVKLKINYINDKIVVSKENIKNYEKQILDNKNQAISLENNIPRIENEINQVTSARDKAADQGPIPDMLQSTIDKRAATVNRFNASINTNTSTIASYRSEIQQIREVINPKLEGSINQERGDIESKQTEINSLEKQVQELNTSLATECEETKPPIE
jgi:predicted  nucleic acid-binding Zn-ribbon protein